MRYLIACLISLGVLGTTLAQDQPEYTGKGKFQDQKRDKSNDMTIWEQSPNVLYSRVECEGELVCEAKLDQADYSSEEFSDQVETMDQTSGETMDQTTAKPIQEQPQDDAYVSQEVVREVVYVTRKWEDDQAKYTGKGKFLDQTESIEQPTDMTIQENDVYAKVECGESLEDEQDQAEYTGKGKFLDQTDSIDQAKDMTIHENTDGYVYYRDNEGIIREVNDQTFNRSYDYLREEGKDPYVKQRSELEVGSETESSVEGSAQGTEKTVPNAEGFPETESANEESNLDTSNDQLNYSNPDLGLNVDEPKNMEYKYQMEDGEVRIEYEDDDVEYSSQ